MTDKLLALDGVVAEYDHGARHAADLVLRVGRRDIDRAVAGRELLHCAGEAAERTGDGASDEPVEDQSKDDDRDADADDQELGLRLRARNIFGGRRGLARRGGDDLVGGGQHLARFGGDDRDRARDLSGAGDPVRECVGVEFHLIAELLLHHGGRDDRREGLLEVRKLGLERGVDRLGAAQAVLDLVAAHQHQRNEDLALVGFRQPRHVLVDDALHHVAAVAQRALDALEFGQAQFVLLGGQRRECGLQRCDAGLQAGQRLCVGFAGQVLDGLQARHRGVVRGAEAGRVSRLRLRDEILRLHLHGGQRILERAAGVGEARGLLHAAEGRIDRALARQVGERDGGKADNGDQRQDNQAGTH